MKIRKTLFILGITLLVGIFTVSQVSYASRFVDNLRAQRAPETDKKTDVNDILASNEGVTIENRIEYLTEKPVVSKELAANLHNVGLEIPSNIKLSQISGPRIDDKDPLNDATLMASLGVTNRAAIAAHWGRGCGLDATGKKITDKPTYSYNKGVADGGAVAILEEDIASLAKTLGAVVIIGGSEGKQRDKAPALTVKQVFNPTGTNGIYVVLSDPVEGTNMQATDTPGAWTAFALVKLPKTSETSFQEAVQSSNKSMQDFLNDTKGEELAKLGIPFADDTYLISFVAQSPEEFTVNEITPMTRSEEFLEIVARKLGLKKDELVKKVANIVLGGRARHEDSIIKPLQSLGAEVTLVGDGDLVPGIIAGTGIELVEGRTGIKPGGAGGTTEQQIVRIALDGREFNGEKAQFIMFRASPKGIKGAGRKDMSGYNDFSDDELETHKDLGIDASKPITPGDLVDYERTVIVSSITGARLGVDLPATLKDDIGEITVDDGVITVKSFIVDKEGRVFITETSYKSEDPETTKLAMLATNNFHLPDTPGVREYAIRKFTDSKTAQDHNLWLHRLEIERDDISQIEKDWVNLLLDLKENGQKTVKRHDIDFLIAGVLKGRLSLNVNGKRSIEPIRRKGIVLASSLEDIKDKMIFDMTSRGKGKREIAKRIKELEGAFGILNTKAVEFGLDPAKVASAYDQIMEEVSQATIAGEIEANVLAKLSEKQKLLLLPTNNVIETTHQLTKIDSMVKELKPELSGHFGKEAEVGHVDKKVPNPKRDGAMEAKMTHPTAVKVMGERLSSKGLSPDLTATNNGSGHATDYNKKGLVPISQVGKITPFLTNELQEEADEYDSSLAQHGTSGSDLDELAELAEQGEIKFNIATNYQQINLNVLSLLDDGVQDSGILEVCKADKDALVNGLHIKTREKIKQVAKKFALDSSNAEINASDTLFIKALKGAYAYGVKKGKIKPTSTNEDIGVVLAKEFKRAFKALDPELYELRNSEAQKAITFLVRYRDNQYLGAVGATNTADLVSISDEFEFAPGHDAFQALRKAKKATIAVNVISYNQIEGHLLAAMDQNAVLILEVARSQLGYALDEKTAMKYIREVVKKTGCKVPIVIHGDHIQYGEKLFKAEAILKEEYEKVNGTGSFNKGIDVDTIDMSILQNVQARLQKNAEEERQVITDINERLINAGFTSIAIDASTIYDEFAGDLVLDHYAQHGTPEQRLVVELERGFALPLEWGTNVLASGIDKSMVLAMNRARAALKDTNAFYALNEIALGPVYDRPLSTALFNLGWLNLKATTQSVVATKNRYNFVLSERKINIVAFSGSYAETKTDAFLKDVGNLKSGQIAVIMTTDPEQEKRLSEIKGINQKLNKQIFIAGIQKESPADKQWLALLGKEGTSYDFSEMKVKDIVNNKHLIIAIAEGV